MVDLATIGETVLHLTPSDGQQVETADTLGVEAVGSASNVAIAAQRVGAETTWCSKLPETPLGRRVAAEIRRHDVDTEVVWTDDGRQGLEFRERTDLLGERRYPDRAESAARTLTLDECPTDVVREATQVYTTGRAAVASPVLTETISSLFEAAKSADTTTAVSLTDHRLWEREEARRSIRDLLESTDVFFTTESAARRMLGDDAPPGNANARQAHALASKGEFETVLVSRGARGATVWHDQTVFEHAAPETDTVNERGGDDALFGVFLARVTDGAPVEDALTAGLAAAALTRALSSTVAPITRDDVQQVIDRQERDRRSQ